MNRGTAIVVPLFYLRSICVDILRFIHSSNDEYNHLTLCTNGKNIVRERELNSGRIDVVVAMGLSWGRTKDCEVLTHGK